MAATTRKLTAAGLKTLPPGKHNDGQGLWLWVSESGARRWVLRVVVGGARREMGLGGFPAIGLAEARDQAEEARRLVRDGEDPIEARRTGRREAARAALSLKDATEKAFDAHKSSLRDDGKAGRWLSPLRVHVLPDLGAMPVVAIDQHVIHDLLAPVWREKPDAAKKALARLGIVMKHAAALGLPVNLQAVPLAKALLGDQAAEVRHIPSMPWRQVGDFYASLSNGVTDMALKLLVLTAARSKPVRFATREHFDFDGMTWTIPEGLMKGRRTGKGKATAFRIPLSKAAAEVAEEAVRRGRGLLFPGANGRPISDMSMAMLMRRRGLDYRPHGFRSSFRTWAMETGKPIAEAEVALSHRLGNEVMRSYARSDLLDRRRPLMESWAAAVTGEVVEGGEVVPLSPRAGRG